MTLSVAVAMALVLLAAGGVWGVVWVLLRRSLVAAETARKLLHMGTGLLGISFLWLFDDLWPVLVLVLLTLVALAVVRHVKVAREGVGVVLHSVDRASWGEFYLPLSIGVLWIAARNDPILYAVPLLIVTFADAVAALVGVEYGKRLFDATEGRKSTEGSFVFAVVAFFCVHVPLLVATDVGPVESLLISAIIGFLVMLVEASAWSGLDNLFIPLFGFLILQGFLPLDSAQLIGHAWVAGVLAIVVLTVGRLTTFQGDALFGAVLVGYLFWTIGGLEWVWAPLSVFAAYTLLPPRRAPDQTRTHNARVLFSVCSAGLVWLIAARLLDAPVFVFAFTVAFAAHLGIISAVRWRWARSAMVDVGVVAAGTATAAVVVLLPYVMIGGARLELWVHAGAGVTAVAVAVTGFQIARRNVPDPLPSGYRWGRQAFWAMLASLLAVLPFVAWRPAFG